MSEYQRKLQIAQQVQAEREAAVRRQMALKKEKEAAAAKEAEARTRQLEDAAKEARRKELMAANAALTVVSNQGASSTSFEYDPFAEDDFGPIPGPSQPKARVANGNKRADTGTRSSEGGGRERGSARSGGGGGGGGGGSKSKKPTREASPQMLGRKEKAARAFEQTVKRQSKADSLFSIKPLDNKGNMSPRKPSNIASNAHRPMPSSIGKGIQSITAGKKGIPGVGGNVNELRKLAPGRADWDRRTIDEIQRDIRNAKVKGAVTQNGAGPSQMGRTASADGSGMRHKLGPSQDRLNGGVKRPRSTSPGKRPSSMTPAKSISKLQTHTSSRPLPSITKKRARSPSSDSSATTSDDSRTGSAKYNDTRRRPRSPSLDENDVSATIQAMFRRPGRAPVRYDDRDSDASSDMEAGLTDQEEEERRTAAIARREDALAEKEERERKERKERLKKERMKGK